MPENLRTIKKDINYLIDELLFDCCMFMELNPGKNQEQAMEIINQAISLRDELINRVNAIREQPVKPQFRALRKDMVDTLNGLFEKVSELAK
ncbi:MAG: hypothetical protein WCQ69_08740 [Bacteroidales bacterium]|jgi:hypothetical protein|nr:hypothetical protein [Bacteroidales bacterium]HHV40306.1 hypothetical protein [Bacteroidales bacterium]